MTLNIRIIHPIPVNTHPKLDRQRAQCQVLGQVVGVQDDELADHVTVIHRQADQIPIAFRRVGRARDEDGLLVEAVVAVPVLADLFRAQVDLVERVEGREAACQKSLLEVFEGGVVLNTHLPYAATPVPSRSCSAVLSGN